MHNLCHVTFVINMYMALAQFRRHMSIRMNLEPGLPWSPQFLRIVRGLVGGPTPPFTGGLSDTIFHHHLSLHLHFTKGSFIWKHRLFFRIVERAQDALFLISISLLNLGQLRRVTEKKNKSPAAAAGSGSTGARLFFTVSMLNAELLQSCRITFQRIVLTLAG